MPANDGEHPVRDLLGVSIPDGTGAPGSQGISAADSAGDVIGSPVANTCGDAVQGGVHSPVVAVHTGDTSGFSDGPRARQRDPSREAS